MSKRARQMALMGFVAGALGDVMRRREQSRLEEAEARKEARLAAIRAEERAQDFAMRKELTQAELAQRAEMAREEMNARAEMAREEMNAREKLTGMEITARKEISAAENAARLQANRDDNAARIKAQQISSSGSRQSAKDDALSERLFIDPATGTTIGKPAGVSDVAFVQAMQRRYGRNIVPYSAGAGSAVVRRGNSPSDDGGGRPYGPKTQPPAQSSFAYDFVKYPKTGKPPQ